MKKTITDRCIELIEERIAELESRKDNLITQDFIDAYNAVINELGCFKETLRSLKQEEEELIKKNVIEFSKWLQHRDNGTEHYNPHTGDITESIGFCPATCLEDNIKTVEELYNTWKELLHPIINPIKK